MATIKVYTSAGVKELQCFDNYDDVDFSEEEDVIETEPEESNPFA